ncbi:MAG: PqqD family peptide modification chaperone [Panacagrimonas sp.]
MTRRAAEAGESRGSSGANSVIALAKDAHLQDGDEAGANTLLLDSGSTVQLNAHAAAILALCDGTRTAEALASEVMQRARQPETLRSDILEFLTVALELGWVVTLPSPAAAAASSGNISRRKPAG